MGEGAYRLVQGLLHVTHQGDVQDLSNETDFINHFSLNIVTLHLKGLRPYSSVTVNQGKVCMLTIMI